MAFPLSLLSVVYLILVGVFALYSFFNLYHLLRFGSPLAVTLGVSLLYLLGTVAILTVSWEFIRQIDWSQTIELIPTAGLLPGLN